MNEQNKLVALILWATQKLKETKNERHKIFLRINERGVLMNDKKYE